MEFKNLLIINLGGIGDFLLSTPAIKALKEKFKDIKISLLVVNRVREIAKDFSYIDKVYVFKKSIFSISNIYNLIRLRKEKFDIAINARTITSNKSARKIKFLLDIISPKLKIGRDTENRGYFFDIKIKEPDFGEKYELEYDIDTVRTLGVNVIDKNIDFFIDKDSFKNVDKILKENNIKEDDTLIGIHPGGQPSRRWPISYFAEVLDSLYKEIKFRCIITGINSEKNLAKKILKLSKVPIIDLVGKLNIRELGAIIKRFNLYITNDTANMHIAAILNTPLIAIFGPGDIKRYDPRNISEKAVVFYRKVSCSPCNNYRCKSIMCLKMIKPKEIIEESIKILKNV